mgnify:FL=1
MKLAVGNTYFQKKFVNDAEISSLYIIYPRFFDNKKKLIKRDYKSYIYDVWRLRNVIEYAIYPDYVREELPLPGHIKYIYVIHELEKDTKAFFTLNGKFKLIAGYASDERYRDYTLQEFLRTFRDAEKWYLGISTKWELREAVLSRFNYGDITTMLLGSFKDLKDYNYVKRKMIELYHAVHELEKQTVLF